MKRKSDKVTASSVYMVENYVLIEGEGNAIPIKQVLSHFCNRGYSEKKIMECIEHSTWKSWEGGEPLGFLEIPHEGFVNITKSMRESPETWWYA